MPIVRKVIALLMVAGAAGCGDDPGIPDPPAPSGGLVTAGPVVGCPDAIGQEDAPRDTYQVVADVVAVPAADRVLEPAPQTSGEGPTRLFAKWGLLVRAGAVVDVSLLPGWADRARLGWGDTDAGPAAAVRVTACRDGAGWSVFAGGTWVAEADCVPIRITTATGGDATAELSIGAPCSRPGG
ncbi:hypothetical protein [Actinoplanes xinjiangensis]|uniref:Uncharacterized protein n=1 Tax=Actinoplanes xinjiangensis TaxID=512350 RepID=A0A316FZ57_9ACTN|nr:hypothetical protein [Actinoplanes xinjiangensis]PWK47427.1 hypothetical protein BC793_10737 [Actinoplanes xinjiangensis]GIF39644.1 hypothetical protein Axi01nite_39550 [Actinoplanes xinjiangensis]